MLAWLRGDATTGAGMAGVVGALEELFSPAAANARAALDSDHELQLPAPTPGDLLLRDGVLVLGAGPGAAHGPERQQAGDGPSSAAKGAGA